MQHDVVGVFADATMADAVAKRVTGMGVPAADVRVGDPGAVVESLKAEMREEVDKLLRGPGNVGPFTKEMSKGIVRFTSLGLVAGAVLALPLGLIEWWSLSLVSRLVIAACVGAVTGATIGFEIGGGFGAKGPAEPLAAERGVPVSVTVRDDLAASVVRVMREANPIRLDLGTLEGNPVATLETEDDRSRAAGGGVGGGAAG